MHDLPIACSLDAAALPARLGQIRALGRDALVSTDLDGRVARLRFADHSGVHERVEAIAEAEGRCCPFLALAVAAEPGAVVLTIRAPEGAEGVLAELAGAFAAAGQAPGALTSAD